MTESPITKLRAEIEHMKMIVESAPISTKHAEKFGLYLNNDLRHLLDILEKALAGYQKIGFIAEHHCVVTSGHCELCAISQVTRDFYQSLSARGKKEEEK